MNKQKDPAAVALGRKGGKNSRKNMTPERASEIARQNVAKRKDRQKKKDNAT